MYKIIPIFAAFQNMFAVTSPALMASSSSLTFLSKPSLLLRPLRSPYPRFTCSISSSSSSSSSSFEFDISFAPPAPKPKPESGVSRLDQFIDASTGRQLFIPWIVRGEDGNLTLQSQPPTSYLHAVAESEAKPKKKKDSTSKSAVQPKLSKAARRFYNENFRDSSQRLSKVLAAAGVASRRSSEELIFDGKVTVNGSVCNTPQTRVDPARDVIYVNGNRLPKKLPPRVYLALNKPKGYICSSGEKESKSVMSLFDDYLKSWDKINQGQPKPRLFTVGRLDVATTGLIIVTNDGDFAQSLSHPSSNFSKEYIATIDGDVSKRHLVAISEGTFIDGIQCIPDSVELLPRQPDISRPRLRIVVHEGRNHEVRELVKNAGLESEIEGKEDFFPGMLKGRNTENMHSLKRVRIGGYRLPSDLGLGKHIELRQSDLKTLNWRN